jgi:hypothetical protein
MLKVCVGWNPLYGVELGADPNINHGLYHQCAVHWLGKVCKYILSVSGLLLIEYLEAGCGTNETE